MEYESKTIPISKLQTNSGQLDGVPTNPRKISKKDLEKLRKSLRDFPDMLKLRELVVVPFGDNFVVLGGNQRLTAAKAEGFEDMPCKVLAADTPAEVLREFVIKDNQQRGEDDWDLLQEWQVDELQDWGVDIPEEWTANPDDYGTEFDLPDGDKPKYGDMYFKVTERQRELFGYAISVALLCDEFTKSETDNENKNASALELIVRDWINQRCKDFEKTDVGELERQYKGLREYLCNALKDSGKTQSEVNKLLGNQMAGHYFGQSQWMFPTSDNYEKMRSIMDLPRDWFECAVIEKQYNRYLLLGKKWEDVKK